MLHIISGNKVHIRLLVAFSMLVVALGIGLSATGTFSRAEAAAVSQPSAALQSNTTGPTTPFDCSQISALGIDRQMNMHAAQLLAECGWKSNSDRAAAPANPGNPLAAITKALAPLLGGTDSDVILPDGVSPHIIQSEDMVWAHGSTIVVNYNDSRTAGACYAGLSTSTNGGTTWTSGQPFCAGHGANYGDPIVVWDNLHARWVAGDLAGGCGGQGLGIWTSLDGVTWSVGPCAHSSTQDDRESMYVDNNPASPRYGTMYISFANYNLAGPPISVMRSTDGGTTWSIPINLALPGGVSFVRNVQDTGDTSGTFYIAAMNEGGGGLANRTNYMYRSTDGGLTWSAPVATGPAFAAPGVATSGYFALFFPTIWRYEGWGQPAGGPGGVVHYAYTQHGSGADPGDIYYVRSTDSGLTWSVPLKMNQDVTTNGNWQPSVAATSQGAVLVSWYDGRNGTSASCGAPGSTTACYQRWGRISLDNGATWQADSSIGDGVSGLPAQGDANIQTVYEGDYDYSSADGTTAYTCWNDGRTLIAGSSQQDVFCDKVSLIVATPTPTRTATPTATPTCNPLGGYNVLIVYADTGVPSTLPAALAAEPGIASVTLFDGAAGTPTLAQLQQYQIVVPFSNSSWVDQVTMGNNLGSYLAGGGIVVALNFDWFGGGQSLLGTWSTTYTPFTNPGTTNFVAGTLGTCTFAPLCTGVATLNAFYRETMSLAPGATLAGTWNDANPMIAYKGRAVAISAYLGDAPNNFSGQYARVIANAGRWLSPSACAYTSTPTSTSTPTATATFTPTATPIPCGAISDYAVASSTGAVIVPGTVDIGNHCDDCTTSVALPFSYKLYDQTFTTANVDSNGTLQFVSNTSIFGNSCLSSTNYNYAIFPHWDDLYTMDTASGEGIFTSISGVAPNRIFNIEWRAVFCCTGGAPVVNFEVRLYEGQARFDIIYGNVQNLGVSATVGVQRGTGPQSTQYSCNTSFSSPGLMLTFSQTPCRVVGHVVWEGLPAQPNQLQQMPITFTLKLGTTEQNFGRQLTDSSGFFTVTTSLPALTYNWRAKGNTYLSTGGAVALNAPVTQLEMGVQRTSDLNGDDSITVVDFNFVKTNFGRGGVPPIRPDLVPFVVLRK